MTQIEQAASASIVSLPSMRPGPTAEGTPLRYVAGAAPAAAPHRRGTAFAMVAGLVCGVLGFLVTPALLGPAALVGGFAGEHLGRPGTRKPAPVAILAVTVAALVAALVLR